MPKRRPLSKNNSISKDKPRRNLQISKQLFDGRNRELLRVLRAEPRIAISELARRMKMSAPAVRERLARLQESGVIGSWRIDLDPVALGYPVLAYVRVRPLP